MCHALGKKTNACRVSANNRNGKKRLENLSVDGCIILKGNKFGGCELDISGSGKAKVAGCCDDGNEFSVYVEFVKLFG